MSKAVAIPAAAIAVLSAALQRIPEKVRLALYVVGVLVWLAAYAPHTPVPVQVRDVLDWLTPIALTVAAANVDRD